MDDDRNQHSACGLAAVTRRDFLKLGAVVAVDSLLLGRLFAAARVLALPLDVTAIMRLLPHRYPFLLVDRIVEFAGDTCRAIKNVTINEPFFVGHFPGHPVMPGVLILEAMAQTAAVHACLKLGKQAGEQAFYLVSMDKARFRKPVVPGDQLVLTTSLLRGRGRIWKFRGEVHVAGQLVSEAEFMATLPSALAQEGQAGTESES